MLSLHDAYTHHGADRAQALADAGADAIGFLGPLGRVFSGFYTATRFVDETIIGGVTGTSLSERLGRALSIDDPLQQTISEGQEAYDEGATLRGSGPPPAASEGWRYH